jgi:amidohydrolase
MNRLIELRHRLHRQPERSGQEKQTAETLVQFLEGCRPERIMTGLGGHGLAAVFAGEQPGPRVLVRCELDALPIPESLDLSYRSEVVGVSHKCGHDGHMAILAGLAERLQARPALRGSTILLFQPSEETGEGAARVLSDRKFQELRPDYVMALHNLPGYELGQVIIKGGAFASASTGLHVHLLGRTAHAAEPEAGNSPALAVAQLIQVFSAMPQYHTSLHEAAKVTVIQARVGEIAYGTSPGEGDVRVTLRAYSTELIDRLTERAKELAGHTAGLFGLKLATETTEIFPATANDPDVIDLCEKAAGEVSLKVHHLEIPFGWSEDFGHFTSQYRGALIGLGAGTDQPPLHHPDYDFPDDLIPLGIELLASAIRMLQDRNHV